MEEMKQGTQYDQSESSGDNKQVSLGSIHAYAHTCYVPE